MYHSKNYLAEAPLFILICCVFLQAAALRAEVVLFDDGVPPASIYVPEAGPSYLHDAAKRLSDHFGQMTGATFPVVTFQQDAPTQRCILITTKPVPEGTKPDDPRFRSSFSIRTENGRLQISGGGAFGILYGIYDLLETDLGCRFFSHNEQFIPKKRRLVVSADRDWTPPFAQHDLFNREAQHVASDTIYKLRSTSPREFTGNHTLNKLLEPYIEAHPGYLPLNKKTGARKANNLHFCYTAEGIAVSLAEALEAEVKERDGNLRDYIYFAGMGDWYGGMCMCADCQSVYEEQAWVDPDGVKKPGYSATLLKMINRAAQLLEQKYPGVTIGTFAYMSLEAPPRDIKPRDNVIIQVPRLRHCTVHPVDQCEHNRSYWLNLQRWCDLAPGRVYIWEYGVSFANMLMPFPCMRSIASNIRAYQQIGVAGVMVQGNYVSMGSDAVVVKNMVWSRMFRDPAQDIEKVITRTLNDYYGPAANDVAKYFDRLEASVQSPKPVHADEFANPRTYLTDQVLDDLEAVLDRAAKSAGATPYDRRIKELRANLDAARFWKPGPLVEGDGWLIREDFGFNTYPRALDVVKYSRSGSPREFGDGRAYHQNFLAMHGGPLAKLSNGPLVVSVAPAMSGRIRSVRYGDHVLLQSAIDHPSGGIRTGEFDGRPTSRKARIVAESGIQFWESDTKHMAYRTVELLSTDTVQILGSIRRVSSQAQYESVTVSVRAAYLVDNIGEILIRNRDSHWEPIELDSVKRKRSISGVTAVQISHPKAGVALIDEYVIAEKSLDDLLDDIDVGNTADEQHPGYLVRIHLDSKAGLLRTDASVPVSNIPRNKAVEYLDRRWKIVPLER